MQEADEVLDDGLKFAPVILGHEEESMFTFNKETQLLSSTLSI